MDEIAGKLQIWENANWGQPDSCKECGKAGIVGDDLMASYRVVTMAAYRSEGYFWFHVDCLPEGLHRNRRGSKFGRLRTVSRGLRDRTAGASSQDQRRTGQMEESLP